MSKAQHTTTEHAPAADPARSRTTAGATQRTASIASPPVLASLLQLRADNRSAVGLGTAIARQVRAMQARGGNAAVLQLMRAVRESGDGATLGEMLTHRSVARPYALQREALDGGLPPGGLGDSEATGAALEPDAPVAKLHLYVDIDVKEIGLKALRQGMVGHTWIAIEYDNPHAIPETVPTAHQELLAAGGKYADPMGFWPDTANNVYYSTNPFKSWVQGWMRHPDRAHEGAEKATQTWRINQAEVDSVIRYAESKRGAKYSVYFFNCTHFGKEAVEAAGKTPPSMSTTGIAYPNAAYEGIKARQEQNRGTTMVKDIDTGKEHSGRSDDI